MPRAFLERAFEGYFEGAAFRCLMFLLATVLFVLAIVSGVVMVARQWDAVSALRRFDLILLVVVTAYPWLFELRAHGYIRRLLRAYKGEDRAALAKGVAANSLSALCFAYAVAGWAFALLASAQIH